jgi:hypothetical protein
MFDDVPNYLVIVIEEMWHIILMFLMLWTIFQYIIFICCIILQVLVVLPPSQKIVHLAFKFYPTKSVH